MALASPIPIVGTLFAAEEAVVSTKAAGILERTYVDVGASVAPEAPLTQVDAQEYEVAVAQSEASLAEVLARLGVTEVPGESFQLGSVSTVQRAAAQLENARFTFDRLTRLREQGQSVSEQELSDVSTRFRVAEADHRLAIDEAAALAASARERASILQIARQKLKDTLTQTPPIPSTLGHEGAGEWIVSERLVTEGQYLRAADPLYRLIISHPLKLRSRVPERYAAETRVGQAVELEVVGGRDAPRGEITRVSPSVDPVSRTFEVEALIDNSARTLKPGAFAKGVIVANGTAPSVCVPSEAILTSGGSVRVFVVENGIARPRKVQLGRMDGEWVEIVSGLVENEQVVRRGAATLTDGVAVEMVTGS